MVYRRSRATNLEQIQPDRSMASQSVAPQTRIALSRVLQLMVDEYGSEWEIATRIDMSQASVNRAITCRSAGPVLLQNVLKFLRVTEGELVEQYAPMEDAEIRLSRSKTVKAVSKGKAWLPVTVQQLEVAWRNNKELDDDALERMGSQLDLLNKIENSRAVRGKR